MAITPFNRLRRLGTGPSKATSSSSRVVHVHGTKTGSNGRNTRYRQTLTHGGIGRAKTAYDREQRAKFDELCIAAQERLDSLRDLPEDAPPFEEGSTDWEMLDDVVDGIRPAVGLSGAGGEFEAIVRELEDDLRQRGRKGRTHYRDHRTRSDRTETRTLAFQQQMSALTSAYGTWCETLGKDGLGSVYTSPAGVDVQGSCSIRVVDLFTVDFVDVDMIEGDEFVCSALVRQGLMPCAPLKPTVAITIRTLELYRLTHLRCPRLAIQPFVKSLCDIHCTPFRSYLAQQFSIAFDVYLAIRRTIALRVQVYLGRDGPGWRLRNTCPPCMYKLKNEVKLSFSMLLTYDGGDSAKRIIRRKAASDIEGEALSIGDSCERIDTRKAPGDYFVDREAVDKFSKEALEEEAEHAPAEVGEDLETNPCAERWKNMINDLSSKMWGIFDETGIFLGLCRHGFVLMAADMVRSGELSKYPLALVETFLEAFGDDLGCGYDVGCKFGTTVNNSPLGPLAREKNFKSLVGAFHGHAHNRRCQLSFLATYTKGMGLEDLEGCERFFSKLNELASSIRYASVFHRHQAIVGHMEHTDNFDTYHNLSSFLVNNYKQALEILQTSPALEKAMRDLGVVGGDVFEAWLMEEKEYLVGLSKEPLVETLEMEYYQKLVNLASSEITLEAARQLWTNMTPETHAARDMTASTETSRRHALETRDKDLSIVQGLETKLGIQVRWVPECPEWRAAAALVSNYGGQNVTIFARAAQL